VGDLALFQKFMQLCAARAGQQLNISDLASSLGLDQKKIKQWISVLETSYILFLLKPHFQNFNKRLSKTPKLYFYDTGLACSLLNIKTTNNLSLSPYRGSLFENLIISDFYKQHYNLGLSSPPLYFWRDQNGRIEVDCILDRGDVLIPIEIKSSETISPAFFSSLSQWREMAHCNPELTTVIYGGNTNQTRKAGKILGWQSATRLIENLTRI
jgi:predicted AAA+ superfamily ATPase